jgi:predicted ATPase
MMETAHASLVDRNDELADLRVELGRARLVTVTGPGGVGKTSLAWALGADVGATATDRTWWVELAAADDTDIADTVAGVVGDTRAGVDVVDALIETLSGAPTLLVLDNCDRVVEPVAALLDLLLPRCPALRVLATSRVPLVHAEEVVYPLAPMLPPVDGADLATIEASPAVALFETRARAVSPFFRVTAANADAVADICRHLEGLPLAIELAAARVHTIAPIDIAQHLDDRLHLLRKASFHRSGRHLSLTKALSWSYELLTGQEQQAFDRLAVFSGSFTDDAAAAVTDIPDRKALSDLFHVLVARSMVGIEMDIPERRYRVLDSLREFGERNLLGGDNTKPAYDALRSHYLAVAEQAAVGLQGPDEARWVALLQRDLPNLRTVFTRAVKTIDVDTALRLVVALFDFAFHRMRREVGTWAEEAIALPGAPVHHLYGKAAGVAGYLAWQRGATDDAAGFSELAVAHSASWVAYDSVGTIELFRGRVDRALPAYTRAVAVGTAEKNDFLRSIATAQLGFAHVFAGIDDAAELTAEATAVALALGNPTAVAFANWATGTALFDSDPKRAVEALEHAVELAAGVDNRITLGAATTTLEELHTKLGGRSVPEDLVAALGQVENWLALGNAPNVWLTVRRIGRDLAALDAYEAAALAFGAEAAAESKLPLRVRERDRHAVAIARTRESLGEESYAHHAARGASLSPDALLTELRIAAAASRPADG